MSKPWELPQVKDASNVDITNMELKKKKEEKKKRERRIPTK